MYSMVPSCFLHIRTSVVNQIITVPQLLPRGLNLTKSSTNNVTKLNPQHKQHHVIVGHHMWSNVTWTEGRPVSQIGSKKGPCRFYLKFHEAPNQPCTASRTLSFEIHDCRLKKWSSSGCVWNPRKNTLKGLWNRPNRRIARFYDGRFFGSTWGPFPKEFSKAFQEISLLNKLSWSVLYLASINWTGYCW